jgi:hypothetical protein
MLIFLEKDHVLRIGRNNEGRTLRRRGVFGNQIDRLSQRRRMYPGVADIHAFGSRKGRVDRKAQLGWHFLTSKIRRSFAQWSELMG